MTAPFDTALFLLAIGGIIIYFTWDENYGSQHSAFTLESNSFVEGFKALMRGNNSFNIFFYKSPIFNYFFIFNIQKSFI